MEEIKVGMGCTVYLYSDRHAYTISRISKSGKSFWATRDTAIMKPGHNIFTDQEYDYTSYPDGGFEHKFFLDKKGNWKMNHTGYLVGTGYRKEYYDPSF